MNFIHVHGAAGSASASRLFNPVSHSGQAPRLVCPYHQWIYDLDGRLLRARDMGEDFDPEAHGLRPVQCRTLAGLVYTCLAEEAPDFDAFADLARRKAA